MPRVAPGAATSSGDPLDVRAPDVVRALADAVAILGADFRPRVLLGAFAPGEGDADPTAADARMSDWIHPADTDGVADAVLRACADPSQETRVDARVYDAVVGWHVMTLAFRSLLDHPDVQGIVVRALEQNVFEREARWRTLVAESPIGIFEQDLEGKCTFVNPAFERIMGVPAAEALGFGWCRVVHQDDLAAMRDMARNPAHNISARAIEMRIVGSDASWRWVSARSTPLRGADGNVTGFLGTIEEVTERHRLEEKLEFDATHDRLTGLGSRALLAEELGGALARARRSNRAAALLFIDLDGFKRVNDMLGHATGDELLVQVAQRLTHAVRDGDVCVRLGGDEFVVCCADMDDPATSDALANRLLDRLRAPYDVHGHEVVVGASIGIAVAQGDDPVSVDQLLSNADLAAYRAKRMGRGRVVMFDEDLRRRLAQGRRIARRITALLEEPTLPLLYAPIVSLGNGGLVGFDCTVDWEGADLHDRDAIELVVEEAGMARALDSALIRTVLRQLAAWETEPPGPIVPGLSVVLSRTGALSPDVPDMVREQLATSRVVPSLCWIGIPEAAVAQDLEAAAFVADALDDLGVGVGLRDFGSAVSSLEQLRLLPAPTLTVTGQLVDSLREPDDDVHTTLLDAIMKYARSLGRVVMAVGVHDKDHAARLQEVGCGFGSGPAFGAAMRADQIAEFIARRSL
jgi:diguanylate cyclase (GGDEF)-like protein/PAS domain S-box-containing protein